MKTLGIALAFALMALSAPSVSAADRPGATEDCNTNGIFGPSTDRCRPRQCEPNSRNPNCKR